MSMKNAYLLSVLEDLKKKNAHEPEFLQGPCSAKHSNATKSWQIGRAHV